MRFKFHQLQQLSDPPLRFVLGQMARRPAARDVLCRSETGRWLALAARSRSLAGPDPHRTQSRPKIAHVRQKARARVISVRSVVLFLRRWDPAVRRFRRHRPGRKCLQTAGDRRKTWKDERRRSQSPRASPPALRPMMIVHQELDQIAEAASLLMESGGFQQELLFQRGAIQVRG